MNDQPPSVPSVNPPPSKPSKISCLAIASLVLGILGITCILKIQVWERERERRENCISNVKQIGLACAMYADLHGKLLRNFDDLKGVITSTKIFICPSAKDKTHYSYAFTAAATNLWQDDPDVIILREIEANHCGMRTILYADGHAAQRED